MPFEFRTRRTVEFSETDLAGVMHFANFFRHMEATEHAFLFAHGQCVHRQEGPMTWGWPRVEATCRYLAPLKYGDLVEIHLLVASIGTKAVSYSFAFEAIERLHEPEFPRQRCAVGRLTAVYVTNDNAELQWRSASIPTSIKSILEVAPASALQDHTGE